MPRPNPAPGSREPAHINQAAAAQYRYTATNTTSHTAMDQAALTQLTDQRHCPTLPARAPTATSQLPTQSAEDPEQ